VRQSDPTLLIVADAEQMRRVGEALGRALMALPEGPLVVFLRGELGAGKTTLVGGIVRGAGVAGLVRSPTYTLIEPYDAGPKRIFHLDLYRLADPQEVEPLGIRDLLTRDTILLIEWPERGGDALAQADLEIDIGYSHGGDGRELAILANSTAGSAAKDALRLS
jgi:tRNA threonylcarbamoyladenosine biosynthesis protein TsaE